MHTKPIIYSILACFIWGLIFVVPLFLTDLSSFDICLGRYLVYGSFSLVLFFLFGRTKGMLKYWKQAAICTLVVNFTYYISLNIGMRLSSPAIIALIIGSAPLVITAFAAKKEKSAKGLLFPSIIVFLGLNLINFHALMQESSEITIGSYFNGMLFGIIALLAWVWYVIYNTSFLTKNPEISPKNWTILIGIMTFVFASIGLCFRLPFIEDGYLTHLFQNHFWRLTACFLVLGIFCSWLAYTFWNMASKSLSSALSGQIAILETVFGLVFIYLIQGAYPSLLEFLGITSILLGVWMAIRKDHKKNSPAIVAGDDKR